MNGRHSLVAAAAVAALFAVVIIASSGQGMVRKDARAGVVSKEIGGSVADKTASFRVILKEGDPEHESAHVFESLAGVPGLATATLLTASAELQVGFDSKAVGEKDIRAALVRAGYVTATADDAVPLEVAVNGKLQSIALADDHGFKPNLLRAKRGIPIELRFMPGTECRVAVSLPALGKTLDISKGAKMRLPGLDPGAYEILCSGNATEATILVD